MGTNSSFNYAAKKGNFESPALSWINKRHLGVLSQLWRKRWFFAVSSFLEHKGWSGWGFLNLPCSAGSQGLGKLQHWHHSKMGYSSQALPWFHSPPGTSNTCHMVCLFIVGLFQPAAGAGSSSMPCCIPPAENSAWPRVHVGWMHGA